MLIGLSGRAASGKDTACQFIMEWGESEGRAVRREAFADRLKLSAARALGFKGSLEEAVAFCNEFKEHWHVGTLNEGRVAPGSQIISFREYLQYYGTEAHREIFGNDFWINAVLETYPLNGDEVLVVTDVRFANEADAIHDWGGEVWQLIRPGVGIAESAHASEQPLGSDKVDRAIANAGDLDDLRAMVQLQMEQLALV